MAESEFGGGLTHKLGTVGILKIQMCIEINVFLINFHWSMHSRAREVHEHRGVRVVVLDQLNSTVSQQNLQIKIRNHLFQINEFWIDWHEKHA